MVRVKEVAAGIKKDDVKGKLIILGFAFSRGQKQNGVIDWSFVTKCSCGHIGVVLANALKFHNTSSCFSCSQTVHGDHGKRLHYIWYAMVARCGKRKSYKYISVCEEWKKYINFRDWALANGYEDYLTLDRFPNQAGNYEPSNCRWTTVLEQNNNKWNNRILTAFGEKKTVVNWARDQRCRVHVGTLYARIEKFDAVPELAISTPAKKGR